MNFKSFLTEGPQFNDRIKTPQDCAEFLQDVMSLNADLIEYLKNRTLNDFLKKFDSENRMETPTLKSLEKALSSANVLYNTLEFIESDVAQFVE